MSFHKFKRFQNIIAIQNPRNSHEAIAFHTENLQVANITQDAYLEMTDTDVLENEIPIINLPNHFEAREQLEQWNTDISQDLKSGEIKFGIRSLTINVTQICNLKCTYCAAGGDGTYGDPISKISIEKTFPQLQFFIEALQPGRKFNICFVGGEPLLYSEGLFAICEYVNQAQKTKHFIPVFSIVTNGTLITDKILDGFKKYKINITVSFDGESDTNDQLRPTKNGLPSTQLTIEGIKKISTVHNEIGSLGFSAVLNETFQNLTQTYHFFSTFNPHWMEFTLAYSQDKPELQKKYISEMNEIATIAWDKNGETELRKIKTFDHYFNLLDSRQKVENHCGAGKSYLMVDAKNRLYTCPWTVNDPNEVVGQGTTLDYKKLEEYQKPLIILNNCQTCWAKNLCGGGCMYIHKAHTGEKHKKDKLFCERTRSLLLTSILYYKLSREG